jgi:acyl-CoA dehydrogenase
MDANEKGRDELRGWLEAQPDNFFEADALLGALVAGEAPEPGGRRASDLMSCVARLSGFGAVAAGPLDRAVRENNRQENEPILESHDELGRPIAEIRVHPSYRLAGRFIYGSGVMAAYREVPNPSRLALSLFYLASHVGEGGHNCPVACTAGAIRALQALGTGTQKRTWLQGLLDPSPDGWRSAAQFLTEVQGGSDVGANALRARLEPDGSWRLWGEKWFCSSADATLFLVTARPEGAPDGTSGLGLFLVPRSVGDTPNGFRLRRLKDKLGTRSMITAEIEFDGAVAEALGPIDRGFRNAMEYVIDTSRLYNAFGCAALAHRAWLVARGFSEHRRAFGHPVIEFPLLRETLAFILSDAEACLAGSYWLAAIQEKVDAREASPEERAFLRLGLSLNKVRTATLAHAAVNSAIEVLGGNGTIESFSVLPRLLRDCVVYENWEGTHHTLRTQVQKDSARSSMHEGLFAVLEERLGVAALARDRELFEKCLRTSDTLMLRRLCDRLGTWIQLAALGRVRDPAIRARAELGAFRHLSEDPDPPGYADLITRCT